MNIGEWIGLVSGIFGFGQLVFAWLAHRNARVQASSSETPKFKKTPLERPVPKWALRIGIFVAQTIAIFFAVDQYNSTEPITRASIILIACLVAAIAICFMLQWIISIYDYIAARCE